MADVKQVLKSLKTKAAQNRKKVISVTAAVLIVLFLGFRNGGFFRARETVIPDVRNMTYEDAVETIEKELKKIGVKDIELHMIWTDAGRAYENVVASQSPKAGTVVHRGDSVVGYLAIGEPFYSHEYVIHYDMEEDLLRCFTEMPRKARPESTVVMRTEVLMDADIRVYVKGSVGEADEILKTHSDSDYWEYFFPMPMDDVTVTAEWVTKQETEAGES